MTAVNTSKHHQPPISPSYINSMFLLASIDTPTQSLQLSTMKVAAQALLPRESIQRINTVYLTRIISALRSVPDISKVNFF